MLELSDKEVKVITINSPMEFKGKEQQNEGKSRISLEKWKYKKNHYKTGDILSEVMNSLDRLRHGWGGTEGRTEAVRHGLAEKVHAKGGREDRRRGTVSDLRATEEEPAQHGCGPGRDAPRLWARGLTKNKAARLPLRAAASTCTPQDPDKLWVQKLTS